MFDKTPLYAIPTHPELPVHRLGASSYWDGGPQTPVAPTLNIPNRAGADPHAFPRSTAAARQQKSDFLRQQGGRRRLRQRPLPYRQLRLEAQLPKMKYADCWAKRNRYCL